MISKILTVSALASLATAHFQILYPVPRGSDNEDTMGNFPCGGLDTVSSTRTPFPITNAPIQLHFGHTQTEIEVLLAIGNDPGSAFNYILVPTFQEEGPGNFCLGGGAITLPSGLNITDGTNATIQVITNGDPTGGLYNCADITFTSTQLSQTDYAANCKNDTVKVSAISGNARNANESSSGSTQSSTSSVSKAGSQPTAFVAWGAAAAVGVAAGLMAI